MPNFPFRSRAAGLATLLSLSAAVSLGIVPACGTGDSFEEPAAGAAGGASGAGGG
jgi:hypothetical protein